MAETSLAAAESARGGEMRFGGWLTLWMVLLALSNGFLWGSGINEQQLIDAVEEGAARVEERSIERDLKPEQIRNAIQSQRDTLPFWRTLLLVGDFLFEPLTLLLRAYAVTVAFAVLAAILGRPVGFEAALHANVMWQGCWAVSYVVRATVQGILPDTPVEISLALFLPPGEYMASIWLAFRQLDMFIVIGWIAMGSATYVRRQSPIWLVPIVIGFLALAETNLRSSLALMLGAAIRVSFTMQ